MIFLNSFIICNTPHHSIGRIKQQQSMVGADPDDSVFTKQETIEKYIIIFYTTQVCIFCDCAFPRIHHIHLPVFVGNPDMSFSIVRNRPGRIIGNAL